MLGDSEEGDDFWREQIAREAHTRFNYDIFRSCAVKSETSFEVRDPKPRVDAACGCDVMRCDAMC